jgi:four helix bundle suffix protein
MSELIGKHGGYRNLLSFQIAQLVYDVTVRFCDRYVSKFSRTTDQMIQAARSGVQNIAEGSQASATSKKTEIKLTQVARASLEELKLDYEDFLRQNKMASWKTNNPLRDELVTQRCKTADDVANWIKKVVTRDIPTVNHNKSYPEYSANTALVLTEIACKLLDRQVERLAKDFENNGGFTEKLYHTRKRHQ